ncbi:MAG: glycosyltransferase [Pseudomonadales bacterium]|jgi:vancomycin aglycone glucosyltransferase|nr:glycosyltransferase [Pseudomonadales bacterium]
MRILISSVGSRGDVQPLLALAVALRAQGQEVSLLLPPNFRGEAERLGLPFIAGGRDTQQAVREVEAAHAGRRVHVARALLRFLRAEIAEQFAQTQAAAADCDLIVAGGLQIAARSVAEARGVPHVYVAFCPAVLPCAALPPPSIRRFGLPHWLNRTLWVAARGAARMALKGTLDAQRDALGLAPVKSVFDHVLTQRPWLATDAALAPAPPLRDRDPVQAGAWYLEDPAPLPDAVEDFLARGDAPVYLGFGSMPSTGAGAGARETGARLVTAARRVGRRAILSRGWADLDAPDGDDDCLVIGPVAHGRLFPRVAAVVHHGGAGTTGAAARAGVPQVIVPHLMDQYYWAHRMTQLGVGRGAGRAEALHPDRLADALEAALQPAVAARARDLGARIDPDGAHRAAERLIAEFGCAGRPGRRWKRAPTAMSQCPLWEPASAATNLRSALRSPLKRAPTATSL